MLVRKLSLAMNAAIAATVAAAWIAMMFEMDRNTAFAARGLRSLRYFTVLSNLLAGAAAAAYAVCLVRLLRGRADAVPRGVVVVKYAAAVSVALTLLVTAAFLAPTARTGFLSLFRGANLWLHLVVPVLCALDFCLLNPDGPLTLKDTLAACVPLALYAAGYVINMLANGIVGPDGQSNDWYGFAFGGWKTAAVAAVVVALATWGVALLMRLSRK